MNAKNSTRKRPAWRRRLIWAGVLLLLYTLIGFFVLPAVIKSQMLQRLPALTKREVAVEQVKLNPYTLSLTIRGFSLTEPGGAKCVSFSELYVNFQFSSMFQRAWVFKEVSLKEPFAQVTLRADGKLNFADLLASKSTEPKTNAPAEIPPVIVELLSIEGGNISVADLTRKSPFRSQITPIQIHLTRFTTRRDKNSPYSFTASTDSGEAFAWSGNVAVNPPQSAGSFKLTGLQLKKYSPYLQDFARFEVLDGKVNVAADYRFSAPTNGLELDVTGASVDLANLQLKAPDTGETVVSIPSLSVQKAEASLAKKTAKVALVKSSGGSILARQNKDGTINLLALLIPPPPETNAPIVATTNAAPVAAPWVARIDEIAFDNYTITVEDHKPAKAAKLKLDQIAFKIKDVSTLTNAPITAELSVRLNEAGMFSVHGMANIFAPSADVQINLDALDLRPFQPYLEEQTRLALTGGALSTRGHAVYAGPGGPGPMVKFTGELGLTNFTLIDLIGFKEFVKWDALGVSGIDLDLQPEKLQIAEVRFVGLKTSVLIGTNGLPNLAALQLEKPATTNTAPPVAAAKKTNNIPITLATLAFDNASFQFIDQSIQPNCNFAIQQFGGTIKGLSSQQQTAAVVDLNGKVNEPSPFSVTGKINPLAKELLLDLTIAFKNTDLTAFTPYTEKFVGYPLMKGKLGLGLHYTIDGKALKAENVVLVDQFTLGAKNGSTNATHLPVKLAVALLKDRHGKIELDLPVSGRLDDPKFKLSGVILQVFLNIITKAVTSPFTLLGSMFGGGEELSFVQFENGSANIPEAEAKKLDTLAKALYERPALSLEITGSADLAKDREAIARAELLRRVKLVRVQELTALGGAAQTVDGIQLSSEDYARLIRRGYAKAFGTNLPPRAAGSNAPALVAGANSPATTKPAAKPPVSLHGATTMTSPPSAPKPSENAPSTNTPPRRFLTAPKKPDAVTIARTPPAPDLSGYTLADMEAGLLGQINVTESELRALMQDRARKVEAYLLKTEKVTAERLFLIAPKPFDASFKGENRVNLSLN